MNLPVELIRLFYLDYICINLKKNHLRDINTRIWIFCLLFFVCNQILQFIYEELPVFFTSYADDLLVVPFTLGLVLIVVRWIKKESEVQLPFYLVVICVVVFSVYFEFYLPYQDERFTSDLVDALCYLIGGVFFYLAMNR